MENFHVFGVYWKFQLLGVGSRKTNIERGAWAVCRFKGGGGLGPGEGGGFLIGGGGGGGGRLGVGLSFYGVWALSQYFLIW